jgi:hypothetical protein
MPGKANLEILHSMRDQLIENRKQSLKEEQKSRRWKAIDGVIKGLMEAAEDRDLGKVAAKVRKMKNLLRKKGTKKELAKIKNNAVCSKCGKPLETVLGDEKVEGSLCVDCAMKSRVPVPGETQDKKNQKRADKISKFPPEAQMGMGAPPAGGEEEPPDEEQEKKDVPDVLVKKKKEKSTVKKKKKSVAENARETRKLVLGK